MAACKTITVSYGAFEVTRDAGDESEGQPSLDIWRITGAEGVVEFHHKNRFTVDSNNAVELYYALQCALRLSGTFPKMGT